MELPKSNLFTTL